MAQFSLKMGAMSRSNPAAAPSFWALSDSGSTAAPTTAAHNNRFLQCLTVPTLRTFKSITPLLDDRSFLLTRTQGHVIDPVRDFKRCSLRLSSLKKRNRSLQMKTREYAYGATDELGP